MGYTERYRPRTLKGMIGHKEIKERIQNLLDRGVDDWPTHLLFTGDTGTGKTAMAEVIARELFGKRWRDRYKEYNASDERGIKVVRTKIKVIAKILNKKIIFLTEADHMTDDAQHAMRRIMERYKKTTIFILDCNYEHMMIKPLRSRTALFRFKPLDPNLMLKFIVRVLVNEKVKLPKTIITDKSTQKKKRVVSPDVQLALKKLVGMSEGDMRFCLNNLETLITKNQELSYKNMLQFQPTEEANTIFNKALSGDLDGSVKLLSDYLIQKNYDWGFLFKSWHKLLLNMPNGKDQDQDKARAKELAYNIMYEMGHAERDTRAGNIPLYQISSFLAYVWRAPQLLEV